MKGKEMMKLKGKRIGFIDYKLENYHANTYLRLYQNDLKKRGFKVSGCLGLDINSAKKWAEVNKVPYFETIEELNENVDFFVVLAPGNPEMHLPLCQMVFQFGKPTYVDKTFSPDLLTAKKIFALADKHKVKMQTTSALRYTNVQDYVEEIGRQRVRHMVAWGGGRSFDEYAIHPIELVVSCMGAKAESVMRRGKGKQSQLLINFSGGRTAVVNVFVNANTPFAASVTTADETRLFSVDASQIFLRTAEAILDLFESGKVTANRKESLIIRNILDVADNPKTQKGFVKLLG